jgi:hypothetical protein
MKMYEGVDVQIHVFLTSVLASHPCRFNPGERTPGTHYIGGRMDPKAGLDDLKKGKILTLTGIEVKPLSFPGPVIEVSSF